MGYGFKECGAGWMYTYRSKNKPVRIDYIFHDQSIKGISYYKTQLTYADLFPFFMKIALYNINPRCLAMIYILHNLESYAERVFLFVPVRSQEFKATNL